MTVAMVTTSFIIWSHCPGHWKMADSKSKQEMYEILEKVNSMQMKLLDKFGENDTFRNLLKETYTQLVSSADLPVEKKVIIYKKYEKLILDITYNHENQLVNEDFQSENSVDQINEILDVLSEVEILCQLFETDCVLEILKCLLWRRGALLYMYCATIYSDPQRSRHVIVQPHFSQYLTKGASYLKKMLTISNSNLSENDIVCQSEDTLILLNNGIRDSTDMLALMYAGEMYYWHATLPNQVSCQSDKQHSAQAHAIHFLQKYIHLAEQSIFKQSWSCERANELLQELINMPRPT